MNPSCEISSAPTMESTFFEQFSNKPLRTLTEQELRTYHEQGYVVIPDVFDPKELKIIDRELERLYSRDDQPVAPGFLLFLGTRSQMMEYIVGHPRLLALVEQIVKPGISIYSSKLVDKLPHSDKVCHWHQDDAYYVKNSNSTCRMSIWFPMQDSHESNGCLRVVPGSHRAGLREHENRVNGTCGLSFLDGKTDLEGTTYCPVKAGSVVLFSALLWHSSLGNQTDQHRRAFIVSYQEATALKGNGAQFKILRPAL